MATTSVFQFCRTVVTEALHITQTLSFTSSRDQKIQCNHEELFEDFRCLGHNQS